MRWVVSTARSGNECLLQSVKAPQCKRKDYAHWVVQDLEQRAHIICGVREGYNWDAIVLIARQLEAEHVAQHLRVRTENRSMALEKIYGVGPGGDDDIAVIHPDGFVLDDGGLSSGIVVLRPRAFQLRAIRAAVSRVHASLSLLARSFDRGK